MTEQDETWQDLRVRLKRYVASRVDVDASDDVVHDILLQVLKNKEKLNSVENPLAWVFTIAKNRVTDYYRKQSRQKTTQDVDDLDIVDSELLAEMPNDDFSACLKPLVERLEPKYREALLLADFSDIKQADAAQTVGISTSGMKSRVQRGRTKLKDALLACCEIEQDRFGKVMISTRKGKKNEDCC